MNLKRHRKNLERLKGKRDQLQEQIKNETVDIKKLRHEKIDIDKAQVIIQIVAQQTQQQLEYCISNVVSLALSSVFPINPYEFVVRFEIRRGRTEADLFFKRNGELIHPLSSSGGGAIDIASFALRVTMWSMNKTRNTLWLDEPFKHLKGREANRRAIQMVKEISDNLDLQIVMVSDERVAIEDIEKGADKIFTIVLKKGRSRII